MCFANLWLFPKALSGKSYDLKPYDLIINFLLKVDEVLYRFDSIFHRKVFICSGLIDEQLIKLNSDYLSVRMILE
jgi:hypothetical protein